MVHPRATAAAVTGTNSHQQSADTAGGERYARAVRPSHRTTAFAPDTTPCQASSPATRTLAATTTTDGTETSSLPPPALIGGRYQRGPALGRGGGGTVYEAVDTRTGRIVAVKLISGVGSAAARRARREVAALRYLRIPGVVRLLDDGFHGADRFLVMERVRGTPLFEDPAECWEDIESPLLALLDTLARVHALGIVHRDLKPGNVILTEQGPIVLDFGIALGRALATPATGGSEGTLDFIAPEQARGEAADARADLYSLGVMVKRALGGWGDPIPAPDYVWALLDRMTRRDPAERPRSAAEVLAALGGHRVDQRVAEVVRNLQGTGPEALRALFSGPEVYHHIPEDGAALLHARSGGSWAEVGAELERWVRSGLATIVDGRVVIDRIGLDRLALTETGGGPRTPGELCDAAEDTAGRLREEGRHALALAGYEVALAAARAVEDEPRERRLLAALAEVALASESPAALDVALYEVERSAVADVDAIATLLRAGRMVLVRDGAGARAVIEPLTPFVEEPLEVWRQMLRVCVERFGGAAAAEACLRELAGWAEGSPTRAAKLDRQLGNIRYGQGRYEEAAALARRSGLVGRPDERLSAAYNEARALLECDPQEAQRVAAALVSEAGARRLVAYEAMGTGLLRGALYRLGADLPPRPELVSPEALADLGQRVDAPFLLCEAGFAWRAGHRALAASLARRAAGRFVEYDSRPGQLLADALELAATGPHEREALSDLAIRAAACTVPDIAVQVYGLLRHAACCPPDGWRAAAVARAAECRVAQNARRIDLLSLPEAAGLVPVAVPPEPA